MQRRDFFHLSAAASAMTLGGLSASSVAQVTSGEGPHAHEHGAAQAPRFGGVIAPLQACTTAVAICIAHCQVLLATGDKSMGACLRTALDCDVICHATLKAAALNSNYTPALAKTAVAAMEACVEACKPHAGHHSQCKDCHDACLSAIAAARKIT